MSIIHVNQIRNTLDQKYGPFIDMSDIDKTSLKEDDRRNVLLSRSLAALSLNYFVDDSPENIAKYITDSYHDNGIDGFYYDDGKSTLYLTQSKWNHEGSKTIERGDIQKFIQGIKDLLNARYQRFNEKICNYKNIIEKAINSSDTKIVIIVIYTGTQKLASEPERDLKDFVAELNDPTEIVSYEVLNQAKIHSFIASGQSNEPINLEIAMENWGVISEPIKAYYGVISATDVSSWWDNYNPRIFNPNIRSFLGDSDVNKSIQNSIINEPSNFVYLNNGITLLCDSVEKKVIGGASRNAGIFECKNAYIINGAQTVGSIGFVNTTNKKEIESAFVFVKIISLENAPTEFNTKVTKATNTQNNISARDFISQDPVQERLRTELVIDGIYYSFRRGDFVENRAIAFDFEEAAVAMATYNLDIDTVTLIKREVSRIWKDITTHPYKTLFNSSLSHIKLWNIVKMHRVIEEIIKVESNQKNGKEKMYLTHGNRFIETKTFSMIKDIDIEKNDIDIDKIESKIIETTRSVIINLMKVVEQEYPDVYLSYLFKNQSKCIELWKKLSI